MDRYREHPRPRLQHNVAVVGDRTEGQPRGAQPSRGSGLKRAVQSDWGAEGPVLEIPLMQVREFGLILQAWQEMLKRPDHLESRNVKSYILFT